MMNDQHPTQLRDAARTSQGFTLIELMIVVAVVAILAAIALPSYNAYVERSHRANARGALLQASQWMERAATAQGRYPAATDIPAGILRVEGGRYTVSFTVSAAGGTYTAVATPLAPQVNDRCAGFVLNQAGTRSQTPTAVVTAPLTAAECWNR
jgi:type IV pilus assembly protein PilE